MLATDVMRTWFATVRPNAPLLDAIRLLLETDQRGLPVIDDNGYVGRSHIGRRFPSPAGAGSEVSRRILARMAARKGEGQLVRERMQALRVDAVMTRNLVCVDETATVDEVVARMDDHQISQLLIVRNGRLVGIVGRMQLPATLARSLSRQS